jgi:hydrogenase maturation protease
MARVLIIGYGNPLRGDDGFGFHAAERLRETIRDPEVEILAVQQLTPELMEPASRAERVIFIDAAAAGEPGKLTVRPVEPEAGRAAAFTHFASPGGLLAGAQVLYGKSPVGCLVSVAGLDFGMFQGLSEPVERALDLLVGSEIHQLLGASGDTGFPS